VDKTWKPPVTGILNIISGALGLIGGLGLVSVGIIIGEFGTPDSLPITLVFLLTLGIPLIVLGALAIAGGVFALKRRIWGLGLAGSISATLFSPVMGIAAIIFTVLSKSEFK